MSNLTDGTVRMLAGWRRVGPAQARVTGPLSAAQLAELIASAPAGGMLARGAGRSYGDAAQNGEGVVLQPVTGEHIHVDPSGASVRAAASVTFTELLAHTIPLGLLPLVLPGTRHLTVGGAIAADVHGKNQRTDGSIAAWIEKIELMDGTGTLRTLLPGTPAFLATVGGLGLTGVIISAQLRLRRIASTRLWTMTRRFPHLDALLAALDSHGSEYSAAWVDLAAPGESLGRGVLSSGEHLAEPWLGEARGLRYDPGRPGTLPWLGVSPVTPLTTRVFNHVWYWASPDGRHAMADLPEFFHRFDEARSSHRALGRRGSVQYQFVVPLGAEAVIAEVITELQRHRAAAFLGTLQRFGPASGGYLSFPIEGWSLAIDLPARPGLRSLLDRLDLRVARASGQVYLAEDVRLSREAFTAMYGDLVNWRSARAKLDPNGIFRSDLGRRLGLVT